MPELGRFGNTFAHLAEEYPLFGIVESLSALEGKAHGGLFLRFIRMVSKKMAGNTEGSVGAACAEKGTEGGYRSHVPSSSSLASRVSGKTSRRPMCFTSNFLFRAAKWRSP